MSATPISAWTTERLLTLPDDGRRYEIIDGELLVTPPPTASHERAVGWLSTLLAGYLGSWPHLETLSAPARVHAGDATSVQPDVFVLASDGHQSSDRGPAVGTLLLAIEVLSPHTARIDRQEKRRLYQREGVDVYWVVDLDSRLVERWRPGDQRPPLLARRASRRRCGSASARCRRRRGR
jgi:Uma2 family endonuclease